ncbi:MAG: hypothetical protein CL582_04470 [Alteromonadaceae bacterium]|nr:hypothetical protein [Alteromonadaceae bacterium]|tara:strand:- start:122 stop:364 length:243 start_codon:yes stop_codon:yes gene_type:complete
MVVKDERVITTLNLDLNEATIDGLNKYPYRRINVRMIGWEVYLHLDISSRVQAFDGVVIWDDNKEIVGKFTWKEYVDYGK